MLYLIFTSLLSFGCPNLTGTFACTNKEGPYTFAITQQDNGGFTEYSFMYSDPSGDTDSYKGITNGLPTNSDIVGTETYTCEGDTLKVVMKTPEGITWAISLQSIVNGDLVDKTTYLPAPADRGTKPNETVTYTCARQQN